MTSVILCQCYSRTDLSVDDALYYADAAKTVGLFPYMENFLAMVIVKSVDFTKIFPAVESLIDLETFQLSGDLLEQFSRAMFDLLSVENREHLFSGVALADREDILYKLAGMFNKLENSRYSIPVKKQIIKQLMVAGVALKYVDYVLKRLEEFQKLELPLLDEPASLQDTVETRSMLFGLKALLEDPKSVIFGDKTSALIQVTEWLKGFIEDVDALNKINKALTDLITIIKSEGSLTDDSIPHLLEIAEHIAILGGSFAIPEISSLFVELQNSRDETVDIISNLLGRICYIIAFPSREVVGLNIKSEMFVNLGYAARVALVMLSNVSKSVEFSLTPVDRTASVQETESNDIIDEKLKGLMQKLKQITIGVESFCDEKRFFPKVVELITEITAILSQSDSSLTDKQHMVQRLNSAIRDIARSLFADSNIDPGSDSFKPHADFYALMVEESLSIEQFFVTKAEWMNAYEGVLQAITEHRKSIQGHGFARTLLITTKELSGNIPTFFKPIPVVKDKLNEAILEEKEPNPVVKDKLIEVLTDLKQVAEGFPETIDSADGCIESLESVTIESSSADVNRIVDRVVEFLSNTCKETFAKGIETTIRSALSMVRAWRETAALVAEYSSSNKLGSIPFDEGLNARLQKQNNSDAATEFYAEFLPEKEERIARLNNIAERFLTLGQSAFDADNSGGALKLGGEAFDADNSGRSFIVRSVKIKQEQKGWNAVNPYTIHGSQGNVRPGNPIPERS